MASLSLGISKTAKRFMQERGIEDVTFLLIAREVVGCCIGMIKEIEPVHQAPDDASNFRYVKVDDCNVFISRDIKILGPLTLTTEGLWKTKRLCLKGATVPL